MGDLVFVGYVGIVLVIVFKLDVSIVMVIVVLLGIVVIVFWIGKMIVNFFFVYWVDREV